MYVEVKQGHGRRKATAAVPVPCGKCPQCVQRRVSQWVFRLQQFEKIALSSLFITLTYDTEKVPITKNGFMSLEKSDLQKFWKRLRKLEQQPIRYYAVGEYGSVRKRPHYHAIVFNSSEENIMRAWSYNHTEYGQVLIGQVHVGTVSPASIAYTAKYIAKGRVVPEHARDDRQKEFSCMSKGLGLNYLTDNIISYHKADVTRSYVTMAGGEKVAMPRYYKNRIYDDNDKWQQSQAAQALALEKEENQKRDYFQRYPDHQEQDYDRAIEASKRSAIASMIENQKKRRND